MLSTVELIDIVWSHLHGLTYEYGQMAFIYKFRKYFLPESLLKISKTNSRKLVQLKAKIVQQTSEYIRVEKAVKRRPKSSTRTVVFCSTFCCLENSTLSFKQMPITFIPHC